MGLLQIDKNAALFGTRFQVSETQEYGVAAVANKSIGPAKNGDLTTRTSASVGTLTMDAGHGFITADKIDLFWIISGVVYSRYNVVVGTVAVNSVPISGGTGDDLPVNNSEITAMVPNEEVVDVVGDNAVFILANSPRQGYIKIINDADAVIVLIRITEVNGSWIWYAESGDDNPLATEVITKIQTSHYDSTAAAAPVCIIGKD